MVKTEIYNLHDYPLNERNGTYGGKAGEKEGITIDGEYWIVKYPKSTKGMRGDLDSYVTSPLSEYIGSHIYAILGIDVHKTLLGIRNNKLVVACKDFCKKEGALREIRTLKNIYNEGLTQMLEESFSSTSSSRLVDLKEMFLHLKYNPGLKNVPGVNERFWEMFIIDILINNNDRNNGNWGILFADAKYTLAPVYDNGASFSNKLPDSKLQMYLSSPDKMNDSITGCTTVYALDGKVIKQSDIVLLDFLYDNGDFINTVKRIVPKIQEKMQEIIDFIYDIPTSYKDITICSDARKQFYTESMKLKFEKYLLPAFEKAQGINNDE